MDREELESKLKQSRAWTFKSLGLDCVKNWNEYNRTCRRITSYKKYGMVGISSASHMPVVYYWKA